MMIQIPTIAEQALYEKEVRGKPYNYFSDFLKSHKTLFEQDFDINDEIQDCMDRLAQHNRALQEIAEDDPEYHDRQAAGAYLAFDLVRAFTQGNPKIMRDICKRYRKFAKRKKAKGPLRLVRSLIH